eukprot:PhM_4_TR11614/c5_g1_i1/m.9795
MTTTVYSSLSDLNEQLPSVRLGNGTVLQASARTHQALQTPPALWDYNTPSVVRLNYHGYPNFSYQGPRDRTVNVSVQCRILDRELVFEEDLERQQAKAGGRDSYVPSFDEKDVQTDPSERLVAATRQVEYLGREVSSLMRQSAEKERELLTQLVQKDKEISKSHDRAGEDWKAKVRALESKIAKQNTDFENVVNESRALQERLDAANAQLNRREEAIELLQKETELCDKRMDKASAQNLKLLDQKINEYDDLVTSFEAATLQVDELKQEKEGLVASLEKSELEKAELQQRIDYLESFSNTSPSIFASDNNNNNNTSSASIEKHVSMVGAGRSPSSSPRRGSVASASPLSRQTSMVGGTAGRRRSTKVSATHVQMLSQQLEAAEATNHDQTEAIAALESEVRDATARANKFLEKYNAALTNIEELRERLADKPPAEVKVVEVAGEDPVRIGELEASLDAVREALQGAEAKLEFRYKQSTQEVNAVNRFVDLFSGLMKKCDVHSIQHLDVGASASLSLSARGDGMRVGLNRTPRQQGNDGGALLNSARSPRRMTPRSAVYDSSHILTCLGAVSDWIETHESEIRLAIGGPFAGKAVTRAFDAPGMLSRAATPASKAPHRHSYIPRDRRSPGESLVVTSKPLCEMEEGSWQELEKAEAVLLKHGIVNTSKSVLGGGGVFGAPSMERHGGPSTSLSHVQLFRKLRRSGTPTYGPPSAACDSNSKNKKTTSSPSTSTSLRRLVVPRENDGFSTASPVSRQALGCLGRDVVGALSRTASPPRHPQQHLRLWSGRKNNNNNNNN